MSFSEEFICDGTRYKLASDCPQKIWPLLRSRVQCWIATRGKEAAAHMFGQASAKGCVTFNRILYNFTLTINPEGNNFNATL